jgi:prophage tail gpP-like protein
MGVYTTKQGDTLVRISIKKYGVATKAKLISDANPVVRGRNEIIPGTVLNIPDVPQSDADAQPREIAVDPDTIHDGISEEVSIVIDNAPYKFWGSVEIGFNFDTLADTFTISTPWISDDLDFRELFKPYSYKSCTLYAGGVKVLTGTIVNIRTKTDAKSRTLTIDGYSKPGILNDVTVSSSSWPVAIRRLNLQQIAQNLSRPYGLNIIFEGSPGAAFSGKDTVDIDPAQKIGNFLSGLARQRGFVMSSDKEGNLLFQKTTTEAATATILEGEYPYITSDVFYNGQNRHSSITAIKSNMGRGRGQKAVVNDPGLDGINRPLVWRAGDTNSGNLRNAAIAQMGRQIAESNIINVSVIGWHRIQDSLLWKDNTRVIYRAEGDMIYEETEFLIRNVRLKKNQNSATSDLTLIFPEAYNGQIRQNYPWD